MYVCLIIKLSQSIPVSRYQTLKIQFLFRSSCSCSCSKVEKRRAQRSAARPPVVTHPPFQQDRVGQGEPRTPQPTFFFF